MPVEFGKLEAWLNKKRPYFHNRTSNTKYLIYFSIGMDSHEHQLTQEDLDADDYTNRFSAWFELVQPLGKGAFGSVFEVIRKSDRAHYAVKVYFFGLS